MKYLSLLIITAFAFTACVEQEVSETEMQYSGPSLDQVVAVVHPTEGNSAEGVVTFTQTDDGVRVQGTISGLDSDNTHGFHVHEYGDCRASDATSAGSHFNPEEMPHAGPMDNERHVGDMGNLESNSDGVAEIDYVDQKIELNGMNSILGLAVVVHAQRDDMESQPVGDAGGRIGCGVIGSANPDF